MKNYNFILPLIFLIIAPKAVSQNNETFLTKPQAILIKEAFDFQFNFGEKIWPEWKNENYPILF